MGGVPAAPDDEQGLVRRAARGLELRQSALAKRVRGDLAVKKLRGLWLEDAESWLYVLRRTVAHRVIGWLELTFVENGDEALSLLRKTRPDVLFTDGDHPGLGGRELAIAVKDDPELRHILTVMTYPEAGPPAPPFDYYFSTFQPMLSALPALLEALRTDCQEPSDDPPWRVLQRREQASVYER